MGNPYNEIRELKERVDALETRVDELTTLRLTDQHKVYYRIRTVRDMVIRLQSLDPNQLQFVGEEYSLGSRLLLPGRPRRLRERMAVEKIPRGPRFDVSMLQIQRAINEGIKVDGVRRRTKRVHQSE